MYQVKVQGSYDTRRADHQRTLGIRTNSKNNNNDDLAGELKENANDLLKHSDKHFTRREKYPAGKFIPRNNLMRINVGKSDEKLNRFKKIMVAAE